MTGSSTGASVSTRASKSRDLTGPVAVDGNSAGGKGKGKGKSKGVETRSGDGGAGGGGGGGASSSISGSSSSSSSSDIYNGSRCGQCGGRPPCSHYPSSPDLHHSHANTNAAASGASSPVSPQQQPLANFREHSRRLSKLRMRAEVAAKELLQHQQQQHQQQQNAGQDPPLPPLPQLQSPPQLHHQVQQQQQSSRSSRRRRSAAANTANMEPPVLSFYGTEPVPLPSRFAKIKRSLTAGHEAELEASWGRLLTALRDEVEHLEARGPDLTPSIDFSDIDNGARVADFARELKRYGLGVVRGVVPRAECDALVADTVAYLEAQHDSKSPPPQDLACFDFFWTPGQVRARAHPSVRRAQKFAMALWDGDADDRMAIRFPIAYADRIRILGVNVGGGADGGAGASSSNSNSNSNSNSSSNGSGSSNGAGKAREDGGAAVGGGGGRIVDGTSSGVGASTSAIDAQKAALELLGDFSSSTVIAQVDNGSLERWEPDGYGRGGTCGTYNAVFRGEWECYDPWDPTFRVSATTDLYNGYGACSVFRMFQGVLALTTAEPGMIRLLPSPKLATAYFLLRPFFSPKTPPPPLRRSGPEWEAFLDGSNWELDREQTTIIHGAVPGHAQRLTELWHPHLALRRTLLTMPTLHPGDYIIWHPDLAYHITSTSGSGDRTTTAAPSRATTPPPSLQPPAPQSLASALATAAATGTSTPASSSAPSHHSVSLLVYIPACPLTQTSALYLARQRKTFQRGHPGPDFDATGSGLGSEASHEGRPGEEDIAEAGGSAGLQAMGLAPFDVAPSSSSPDTGAGTDAEARGGAAEEGEKTKGRDEEDVNMEDGVGTGTEVQQPPPPPPTAAPVHHAEAEVARLANIILFPDRYDFYMARRNGAATPKVRADR